MTRPAGPNVQPGDVLVRADGSEYRVVSTRREGTSYYLRLRPIRQRAVRVWLWAAGFTVASAGAAYWWFQ